MTPRTKWHRWSFLDHPPDNNVAIPAGLTFCLFLGQLCQIPVDPCSSSPCRNGATCATVGPNRQFRCICPADFTGDFCENELQGRPFFLLISFFFKFPNDQMSSFAIDPLLTLIFGWSTPSGGAAACGGFLDAVNGTLTYPASDGAQYPHMVRHFQFNFIHFIQIIQFGS